MICTRFHSKAHWPIQTHTHKHKHKHKHKQTQTLNQTIILHSLDSDRNQFIFDSSLAMLQLVTTFDPPASNNADRKKEEKEEEKESKFSLVYPFGNLN